MDNRSLKANDNKDKTTPAGMPPLDSGKNVSPMESSPQYRSIAMMPNFQPAPGFASLQSQSRDVKRASSSQVTVEQLGLRREDFEFSDDATMPRLSHSRSLPLDHRVEPIRDQKLNPPVFNPPVFFEREFKPLIIKKSWANPQLRPIPNYYPMERSSRILNLNEHEHKLEEITGNVSECFRVLGIQAKYFESPAGAALLTPEQVEIYLYLWKAGGGKQVCVEVQRRRGDSVTFHRYARHILEAASGDFDPAEYKDYSDSHYLKAAEKLIRTELTKATDQRQESLIAIELAAGLIKKDRFDARILGMESLCILTDPRKTNLNTALLASRAVLFGVQKDEQNPMFRNIHEFVLNVVQKRCMGDEESLLEDMVVEYDSDDEDYFDDEEERDETKPPEYHDSMKTLVNYGLTIITNSWEVLTTFESFDSEPETTDGHPLSVDTAVAEFHRISSDLTHTDILTSLLMELGRAESKAHNACLAAKCLRLLCQSSHEARERTKALSGLQRASRAEEVGKETNARLERESADLFRVLQD